MSAPKFRITPRMKARMKAEGEIAACDEYLECITEAVMTIFWSLSSTREQPTMAAVHNHLELIKINADRIMASYSAHVAEEFADLEDRAEIAEEFAGELTPSEDPEDEEADE